MQHLKKIILSLLAAFSFTVVFSQPSFSLCNDLGLQRSFTKEQRFWAIGHTVQGNFHFDTKTTIYLWFSYYSNGKFNNAVTATAKSALTIPQQVNYLNSAKMRLKQFSTGWKKYLVGSFNSYKNWNLYGYAGFGLLLGRVTNTHSVAIDTSVYNVPVRSGKANFKRLTFDLGLGYEIPVAGDIYFYAEGRVWIPTSDYPSKYIFINNNAPFVGMLNVGLRVLFE